MTKKEEKEIEETFLISSTDEAHHTKDEYAYVDKVALSTNKFYMISLLNPRSNPSELFKSNPRKLSYKQKAFLSYYTHCESHVEIDRTLRCLYILKGINKVLNGEISYDYIDKIDKCSAHDLELEAYLTQINYKFTPYDLKLSLINYIEKEFGLRVGKIRTKIIGFKPPRYMYEYYRYEYGIVDNKGADAGDNELLKGTSNNSDSFNFFEFLDYTFIPALTEAVRVDKNNLLSQFIFGISSAFMPVPLSPIIYFVDDLEKIENKRIGYCFLRENLEQQYPPKEEVGLILKDDAKDTIHFLFSVEHVDSVSPYLFAINQLLQSTSKKCPCSYATKKISECPLQNELYKRIREFLLSSYAAKKRIFGISSKRPIITIFTPFYWEFSARKRVS